MNYTNIFQNSQALSVSVGNIYSEDQLMHIFLDNFHQGGKYNAKVESHQAELRWEGKFTDQKYLYNTSLYTDYLNGDISSGSGKNNERANIVHKKYTPCGGANHSAENYFKSIINDKEKYRAAGD